MVKIFIVSDQQFFGCMYFVFVSNYGIDFTLNRGLDEEIRTVVRGQTNIGHEGRQVSKFYV